jgi:hypothetical protein
VGAVELERTADSLASVIVELDAGDLDASKQGRAYLDAAEQAGQCLQVKAKASPNYSEIAA